MRTAGFVLVGGQSSRMGRDKALLPWNSASLVEDVSTKVKAVAGNVALLGSSDRYQYLGYDCLPDRVPGLGPLSGIESALQSRRGELNLIVACDMPGLEQAWLELLLHKASKSDALCTYLMDSNQTPHPLCSVYSRHCLPLVELALQEKRLKMLDLLRILNAQPVTVASPVWNVNTPEEWSAWQKAGAQ